MMRPSPLLALFAAALPSVAFASGPQTLSDLAKLVVDILNSVTVVLIVLGIVIFFYGAASGLFKSGENAKEHGKLRELLIWGVITIFIMVSIWGIIQLLQNSLFPGESPPPNGILGIGTCAGAGSCDYVS